jgi:hypothetical protein
MPRQRSVAVMRFMMAPFALPMDRFEQFDIPSFYLRVLLLSIQLDLSTPIAGYGYFEA